MTDVREDREDELLSAYLDGELPRAEAEELTRRLAREPALSERLEELRTMNRAAVAGFRAFDERPMPKRVLELLGENAAEGTAGNVVRFRQLPRLGEFFRLPVALAASIALVAGLWLGGLPARRGAPDDVAYASRIAESSALHAAFDRAASGEVIELGGDRHATPLLTFLSDGGGWCRQVRITGGPAPADALACRRHGQWQMELVTFGAATPAPGAGAYGQASAGGTPAMRAALDRLMGREPPLGRAEEADVIGREWQVPP
ncbi:MAG TPA: hypothetical protein VFG91_06650 [Woeseiaceae bacterium]|nr:hypothetical protein [Woeseiaceae bacterium]